jgi:hypothetical protein
MKALAGISLFIAGGLAGFLFTNFNSNGKTNEINSTRQKRNTKKTGKRNVPLNKKKKIQTNPS